MSQIPNLLKGSQDDPTAPYYSELISRAFKSFEDCESGKLPKPKALTNAPWLFFSIQIAYDMPVWEIADGLTETHMRACEELIPLMIDRLNRPGAAISDYGASLACAHVKTLSSMLFQNKIDTKYPLASYNLPEPGKEKEPGQKPTNQYAIVLEAYCLGKRAYLRVKLDRLSKGRSLNYSNLVVY